MLLSFLRTARRRLLRASGAILLGMVALAPALCEAQAEPASTPPPEFRPAPGDPGGAVPPSSTAPEPAQTAPLREAPPLPAPMPAAPVPPPRRAGPATFALVLPLDAPAYARAAAAVRDGFLAAAEAAGAAGRCFVVPHGQDNVTAAFDAARDRGAAVIVGPLVRDDLKTIAIAGGNWPTTLALNQLDDGSPLPRDTYSLALSVESDGRLIARRALSDGARTIAAVESEAPVTHRLAVGFTADWTASGAPPPTSYLLDPSPAALADLRKAMTRSPPDAALLALDADRAALVKPFLGGVVAYASGLLFDRPGPATAHDLEGVRVTEIPWILEPDAPAMAQLPRREYGNDAQTRLYALGLDAFRVARALAEGAPEHLEFDGATGHLVLGADRQFERTPRFGVYRDGSLVPLDAPR